MPRGSHLQQQLLIVASVLIGLSVVAGAYVLRGTSLLEVNTDQLALQRSETTRHLYGNPDAETVIVEFSDYSCGFCARVHPTLKQLVDESNGTIAWEYRHLPILRDLSKTAAVVGECVAELSEEGSAAFFAYTNTLLQNQSALTDDYVRRVALDYISASDLDACLTDTEIIARVEADAATARSLGARGTPYSVILREGGEVTPVVGALPYNEWKEVLAQPSL